jgi:hypothetical protein
VIDEPGNAVVAAEDIPLLLSGVRRAAPFLWWLSIDNSARFRNERWEVNAQVLGEVSLSARLRPAAATRWHTMRRRMTGETALLRRVHHLAQSQYAWAYLFSRLDVLPSKLTDYTVLDGAPEVPDRTGDASISYNPTKSAELMRRLRERLPDVRYTPLVGLDRPKLLEALSGSTVYLDLGHHPGKDRLPREAAMRGAVTVVARRGAGAFFDDVPIGSEHKVDPAGDIVGNAIAVVRRVFEDPAGSRARQDGYRSIIEGERETFDSEVRRVFLLGDLGSDR